MPWFRVDDGFASHPKALATTLAARGLWVTAGSWSSAHLTDGVVPDHVLASLGGTPELAAELVAAGLWRRKRGGYAFHDWLAMNPSKAEVERGRASNARRQALFRDPALKQKVRNRDGSTCRYCGRTVRWGKGRAPDSGTYDHVDPAGPNVLANLVVACMACNSSKRNRTLVECGMSLIPLGQEGSRNASREASPEGIPTRPDPDLSVVDVVDRANGASAARASPDVIEAVTKEILGVTGRHITDEWAGRVAAEILQGRTPANPAAYVRRAIRNEQDPRKRFLPLY